MKYTVTAHVGEDKEYKKVVCVRHNAKNKTIFNRCMNEIGIELVKAKEIAPRAEYSYDLPNIWTNGYLGSAWFKKPFINVSIQEETGAWLAL